MRRKFVLVSLAFLVRRRVVHGLSQRRCALRGDFGLGNIIPWNMGGAYIGVDIWDTNTQRILTNIAAFAVKERAPVTSAQTARAAAPARARAAIEAAINALFFAGLGYALRLGWLGMMDNLPF